MSDETLPVKMWCQGCGQVLTSFLQEMADRNAEVVCPECGKLNACRNVAGSASKSPAS